MIIGKSFIGNENAELKNKTVRSFSPIKGEELAEEFYTLNKNDIKRIEEKAVSAFNEFSKTSREKRAQFLETIADEIMNLGDELLERTHLETGLPMGRMQGERGRTVGQLRFFASIVRKGEYQENVIDNADPNRSPIPKVDIRRKMQAIGPVLVFGASNFPFAFSTAGGDTASALAAGNPVIVKAHNSHLGTNDMVSQAIITAVKKCNMPDGTFSTYIDLSHEVTSDMIISPAIKAIAFTGSLNGGRAIFNKAATRNDTIPVFAEMGSINPVIILSKAIKKRSETIAETLAGSISLGCGQFCTNPGLIFLEKSAESESFLKELTEKLSNVQAQSMLNKTIYNSYCEGSDTLSKTTGVTELTLKNNASANDKKLEVTARLFLTDSKTFINTEKLQEEVFGPSSLIIQCENKDEMQKAIHKMHGQLTGSIIAEEEELLSNPSLLDALVNKVGRIIYNQAPTGVEVCSAMQHGGPYPASTDSRFSSVGGNAIMRFLRPVSYQNFPQSILPEELIDENPEKMIRLVDQEWIR
jgi:2,5-dioxopentanoate dehydrogenase